MRKGSKLLGLILIAIIFLSTSITFIGVSNAEEASNSENEATNFSNERTDDTNNENNVLKDLIKWQRIPSNTNYLLTSIQQKQGNIFVAGGGFISYPDHNQAIVSSAGGDTWANYGKSSEWCILKTQLVNGTFFGFASDNIFYTSTDGKQWRKVSTKTKGYGILREAAGNGKKYVIVGQEWNKKLYPTTELKVVYSSDGRIWKIKGLGIAGELWSIIWDGKKFIAVGGIRQFMAGEPVVPKGYVLTSSDGTKWKVENSTISQCLTKITCYGNIYIALGYEGGVFTSTDLITWKESHLTDNEYFNKFDQIVYNGKSFVAGNELGDIYYSNNGYEWIKTYKGDNGSSKIFWNGNLFVNTNCFYPYVLVSKDGVTWVKSDINEEFKIYDIIWTGDHFLAVGNGGLILKGTIPIKISVNGVIDKEESNSFVNKGTNLYPVEYIAKLLGYTYEYDNTDSTSKIYNDDTELIICSESLIATINGKTIKSDIAPKIYKGKMVAPIRFVAENLGFTVNWDNSTKTILIDKK